VRISEPDSSKCVAKEWRHAYATHQLEAGLPIHVLQRYMGHRNLQTTLRYIHWLPRLNGEGHKEIDLLAQP